MSYVTNDRVTRRATNQWKCRFGIHDWSKWEEGEMKQISPFGGAASRTYGQTRRCLCCGKTQARGIPFRG